VKQVLMYRFIRNATLYGVVNWKITNSSSKFTLRIFHQVTNNSIEQSYNTKANSKLAI
jgi:hypothetical protein